MRFVMYFLFSFPFAGALFERCDVFPYVVRQVWRAEAPSEVVPLKIPVQHVVVTHTEGRECNHLFACNEVLRDLQDYHMGILTFSDIAYNFLVGGDGIVYFGRGWTNKGMISVRYNDKALGIALIGNYFNSTPPDVMLQSMKKLLDCGLLKNLISKNYRLHMHEDLECVSSPAPALADVIKTWDHYAGRVEDYIACTSD